jgi:hypothetical protein
MAEGIRIRQDFIDGELAVGLDPSDLVMESDELAGLQVIDHAEDSRFAVVTIGDEVVHVTEHEANATTATIERGQEQTEPLEHDEGDRWEHSPTAVDFDELRFTSGEDEIPAA